MEDLDMFSLGDMTGLLKYVKGCPIEGRQDLFSIIPECKMHKKGLKLQEARPLPFLKGAGDGAEFLPADVPPNAVVHL